MKKNTIIPALSIPLIGLIVLVSSYSLYTPGFYSAETANWQAQSFGQDLVDLFLVVPTLVIATVMAYRNNRSGLIVWGGAVAYLLYTFTIYCFDLHFNRLFIAYCLTLGLSFYSFAYFLMSSLKEFFAGTVTHQVVLTITGLYFLLVPIVFYFLWLSDLVPAVSGNSIPKSLIATGLLTNPVEVIDLSVFLPGVFLTGVFVLKRKNLGLLLAPVVLVFFVLMDITIGVLVLIMKQKGIETDITVTVIMNLLALFSLALLIWYLKTIKEVNTDIDQTDKTDPAIL